MSTDPGPGPGPDPDSAGAGAGAGAGAARGRPERPAARDEVSELFARALEHDGDPAAEGQDAVDEAFRELIELAYGGDSRAELAMRAIVDVEVDRAEADGVMPTPTRFDRVIDQAWTTHLARRDQDPARGGDVVIRPDGSVGYQDDGDDTDGPDPCSGSS